MNSVRLEASRIQLGGCVRLNGIPPHPLGADQPRTLTVRDSHLLRVWLFMFTFLFHLARIATGWGRASRLREKASGYQHRSCNHQFHKFSKEPPVAMDGTLSQSGSRLGTV